MERARHFGRTKSDAYRRLHAALTGMGFGSVQAREAIGEARLSYPNGFASLEEALREVILAATRFGEQPRRVA